MPPKKAALGPAAVKPDPEVTSSRPPEPLTDAPVTGESAKDAFNRKKTELHTKLTGMGEGTIIYQDEFDNLMPGASLQEMMDLLQALTNGSIVSLLQDASGVPCWQVRSAASATAYSKLNREERMIYSHIEEASTAGIWTRTLQKRTNLHQQVINKSLKALEQSKHVKQIKSVKFPSRKIYMLYELDPGEEVTGGPWFSEGELDVDFIGVVSDIIVRYVQKESWRIGPKYTHRPRSGHGAGGESANGDKPTNGEANINNHDRGKGLDYTRKARYGQMVTPTGRLFVPHPAGYQYYPTASDLLTWMDGTGVLQGKDLTKADLIHMLEMLCFDGKLEKIGKRAISSSSSAREANSMDVDEDDSPVRGRGIGVTKNDDDDNEPEDMYRSVRRPTGEDDAGPGNGLSEVPCSRCPVFQLCEEGGPIDAENCKYFDDWLLPNALTT